MEAGWRPIKPAGAPEGVPQLFVKYTFTTSGYVVFLTDLARVFTERLDRREVIKRALIDNTSIDPSEDASQLKILLDKIRGALAGERKTRLQVIKDQGDALILRATSLLPAPLGTLKWSIHLAAGPAEAFRTEFVVPAVACAYNQSKQVEDLVHHLEEKDHVIGKLLDRLEQTGTDISTVFPGAAAIKTSKKATLREQAARHVKGLGRFDEGNWLQSIKPVGLDDENVSQLVQRVFANASHKPSDSSFTQSEPWWKCLLTLSEASMAALEDENTDMEDNGVNGGVSRDDEQAGTVSPRQMSDFEPVPKDTPRTRRRKDLANQVLNLDEETTDEEDLDAPSKPSTQKDTQSDRETSTMAHHPRMQSSPAPAPEPKPKKLGTIGGSRPRARTPATTSEDATNDDETKHISTSPSKQVNVTPKKPKLGVIGGQKKVSTGSPSQSSKAPDHSHVHSRIGGGRIAPGPSDDPHERRFDEDAGKGNETTNPAASTPAVPEETAQQRADRRRAELKRELEAKAHAPAKKKRRF